MATTALAETASQPKVVLVEDNLPDVMLVEEAIREYRLLVALEVFRDGDEAYRYFDQLSNGNDSCPDLVLLDLNLPKRHGLEVLERIRKNPFCQDLPVIVSTSSWNPTEIERARELGIAHYFRKPTRFDQFLKIGEIIRDLCPRSAPVRP